MMGTPSGQIHSIPITGPDKQQYEAHLDTQATYSVLPPQLAHRWKLAGAQEQQCAIGGQLANATPFTAKRQLLATVTTELGDNIKVSFLIMPTPNHMILLGLPALAQMPVVIKFAGRTLFEGCPPVQVVAEPPTLPEGQGVTLAAGSPEQRKQVMELLLKYKGAMFEWTGKFGLFKDYVEDIPLYSTKPVNLKPYRVPLGLRQPFQEILQEYLRRKIIEPAESPYSSPAFLAPKPHANPADPPSKVWRFCCDYRQVNELTEDLQWPMPDVQELLDALGAHNEFFATIDLRLGYHHIPLTADAKRKTAFSTPEGQFQFRVMSFGMKRSPRVFQRAVSLILQGLVGKICLVYLDDIIVFGKTFAEFITNLDQVLCRLADAGASISLSKSQFLARETRYLGFIIDKDSTRPAPETVEAITKYPQPGTQKELLRFIGLASYVRQFVPHFARYEKLLRGVIQAPPLKLKWSTEAVQAFNDLKAAIAQDAQLRRFDPQLHTEVHTDASQHTIGAVLLQGPDKDHLHPLEYASAVLQPCQTRYSNTERELYAIKWAVTTKFRHYLEGQSFVVRTDHQPLIHDFKLKHPSKRIIYFRLALASYSFTIEHIKGARNLAADALSRVPHVATMTAKVAIRRAWEQRKLIQQFHQQLGHANWKTVLHALQARFTWPHMRQMVWRALITCQRCRTFNTPTTTVGTAAQPLRTTAPHELLCIDLVPMPVANGCAYMLLAVDHFSKHAVAKPVRVPTVTSVIHFLDIYRRYCGAFHRLLSDRGPQFTAHELADYAARSGFTHDHAERRHFEGNGCVERTVRTVQEILAKIGATDTTWPHFLATALVAYNSRRHSTIGAEPAAVFFGNPIQLPLDLRYGTQGPAPPSSQQVQQHTKQVTTVWARQQQARKPHAFAPGDRVLHVPRPSSHLTHSRRRRFRPRRSGPWTVLAAEDRNVYRCIQGRRERRLPGWELQRASSPPKTTGGSKGVTSEGQRSRP